MLFALIAEFERMLTTVDSDSETSSENDDVKGDARVHSFSHEIAGPRSSNVALVPSPSPYPPPNWQPNRGSKDDQSKHDREPHLGDGCSQSLKYINDDGIPLDFQQYHRIFDAAAKIGTLTHPRQKEKAIKPCYAKKLKADGIYSVTGTRHRASTAAYTWLSAEL